MKHGLLLIPLFVDSQVASRLPVQNARPFGSLSPTATNPVLTAARAAEDRGMVRDAENLYREFAFQNPGSPSRRIYLARLLDKQGRDREAFSEYRAVVIGNESSWSSDQEDPRALARFGDLAARFGSRDEAARAYAFAATKSNRDDLWEPATKPRNSSFDALRAAAHAAAAAAVKRSGIGDKAGAIGELTIAIEADGAYWIAHYDLARLLKRQGRMEEATREAKRAEALAPAGKYRGMVREMRRNHGI